jgi:hypothetical protein
MVPGNVVSKTECVLPQVISRRDVVEQQNIPDESKHVSTAELTVKIPIGNLIFGFGVVAFKHFLAQLNAEVEFIHLFVVFAIVGERK